jgi:hypothetical protein
MSKLSDTRMAALQARTSAIRKALKKGGSEKLASAVNVLFAAFDGDVDHVCAFIKMASKMPSKEDVAAKEKVLAKTKKATGEVLTGKAAMAALNKAAKDAGTEGRRDVRGLTVPRTVPKGRVLAHNHIRHTVDMPSGANGFRVWSWPQGKVPKHFKTCGCGYAGLPHVANADHAASYKCETQAVIDSFPGEL